MYKKNHPNCETIFFIFDTSTAYYELSKPLDPNGINEQVGLHYCFLDKNLVKNLVGKGIDYVIWFTPYKVFTVLDPKDWTASVKSIAKAAVFDTKVINLGDYRAYAPECMISAEKQ